MDDSPSLDKMPPEILAPISALLHGNSLLNLRLVCRKLKAATEDTFLCTFFSRRAHTATRYGLQVLVQISASQHLTSKLREVTLVVIHVQRGRTGSRCDQPESDKLLNDMTWEWWEEEKRALFGAKKYTHRLLEEALKNLQQHSRAPALSIQCGDLEEEHGSIFGLRHLLRNLGITKASTRWFFNLKGPDDIFAAMSSAVANTNFPLTTLHLCKDNSNGGIGTGTITMLHESQWAKDLTTLSMGLLEEQCCWFLHEDLGFSEGLAKMTNVHTLALTGCFYGRCHRGEMAAVVPWFSNAFRKHKLRSLTLSWVHGSIEDYTVFLDRHKSTLKHVELDWAKTNGWECWTDVIRFIADKLELTGLKMNELVRPFDKLTDGCGRISFYYSDHNTQIRGNGGDSDKGRYVASEWKMKEELEHLLKSGLHYVVGDEFKGYLEMLDELDLG